MLFSYFFLSPSTWLVICAVVPAVVLLTYINKKDRLEKEPPRLLLSLVLWGIAATFLAVVSETVLEELLLAFCAENSREYRIIMYFVVVAGSEEGFKYLLLKKKTWSSPDFNCRFDAVVYATFVSLGFALWENIGYVLSYGFSIAVARALTAVPGHACFGVFMGACYGMAKKCENFGFKNASRLWRSLSFLVPVLIHGLYDYIATAAEDSGLGFLAFVIVVFAVSFMMVRNLSNHDRFISRRGYYF